METQKMPFVMLNITKFCLAYSPIKATLKCLSSEDKSECGGMSLSSEESPRYQDQQCLQGAF